MIHDVILALGGIGGGPLKHFLNASVFNHALSLTTPSHKIITNQSVSNSEDMLEKLTCSVLVHNNQDEIAASFSIHPCEKSFLKELINIADKYKTIHSFLRKVPFFGSDPIVLDNGYEIKPGMYLRACCDGIYQCLEPYRKNLIELEKTTLENPHTTLSGILSHVSPFVPLLNTLNTVINQIGARKLHGCKILQLIHQYLFTGIEINDSAIARIMQQCHIVMLRQLTGWLLYGCLTDPYGEFFIECSPVSSGETLNASMTTLDSENLSDNHMNESTSADVRIIHDLVPSYIPISVAEKAKFIGLTVLLFSQDPEGKKSGDNRRLHDSLTLKLEESLLQQSTMLQDSLTLDISHFESVLDNMRSFVTQHCYSLVKEKADLIGELTLIKDFYLIGRGEVFVSFLQKGKHTLFSPVSRNSAKELNKILCTSLRNIHLNSDIIIEKVSFKIPPKDSLPSGTNAWSAMSLQYKPPWPLHLLFSASTLTMYNTLFKFLLQVKFAELSLHNVWIDNVKMKDNMLPADVWAWTLRNNLMFVVHSLQCYLQQDVLESEYSILMKELQATQDFEQVIHYHTKFLAHISSQAFVLTEEIQNPDQPTTVKKHPVNKCIVDILKLCDVFCAEVSKVNPEKLKFKEMIEELDTTVLVLMNLVTLLGNRASGLHLLLLRLDYNRYFSAKIS